MEALMENVDVRRAGEGTSIVLQRTLGESLPWPR
jgi:hypothetical protein